MTMNSCVEVTDSSYCLSCIFYYQTGGNAIKGFSGDARVEASSRKAVATSITPLQNLIRDKNTVINQYLTQNQILLSEREPMQSRFLPGQWTHLSSNPETADRQVTTVETLKTSFTEY